TIYARAQAANGALSEWVEASFEVTELLRSKNQGEGCGTCETRASTKGPINFAAGNKYKKQIDLALTGPGLPMGYSRHYNSQKEEDGPLGYGWSGSFSETVTQASGKLILLQADGADVHFVDNGQGQYISETDQVRVIESVVDGYRLDEPDGRELIFDSDGRLMQIIDRNGNSQTLGYADGRLSFVEDNYGRRLDFVYNQENRLATLSSPVGQFSYGYDAQGNLIGVSNPAGTGKTYLYSDPNDPHNLTGIINEKGIRSLTAAYDSQDRAVLSEGAGGFKRVVVAYANNFVRHITDSRGNTTTFKLQVEHGIGRVKSVSGSGCGSCLGSPNTEYGLNNRLWLQNATDANGTITTYTYDARGNILTKTEAAGTPQERTTAYTYHPQYSLVTSITRASVANPGQLAVTTFIYDNNGNLTQKTETGFSGTTPASRITTYAYNSRGQLIRIDGPGTDAADITTFEYYPNDPVEGLNRGRLKRITDPLGHETAYNLYNAYGKPVEMSDANGVVTSMAYNADGRPISRTTAGFITTFEYDGVGNLTATHLPGGRTITNGYTDAGLLERIEDSLGNGILYSYDPEGNRIREEIQDDGGTLRRYVDYEYDGFNRLKKTHYPEGPYEERNYDDAGNLVAMTDPKGLQTQYGYDPLNRLATVTQPDDVTTAYTYDGHDNLLSVTDAENHETAYTYDDLGRLMDTVSPDTGSTSHTYDGAGNLISKADANGSTTTYTYDVLNRLTAVHYPDASQDVTYSYDEGTNGQGRLTGMTDPSGAYAFSYDALGNLIEEQKTINGIAYSTQYTYGPTGLLTGMTYPSGRTISYTMDTAGRVTRVATTMDGQTQTLAEGISYLPFGTVEGLTYGNGIAQSRSYNQRYQIMIIASGTVQNVSYALDPVGNVMSIADNVDSSKGQTFSYDNLYRLTNALGSYGTIDYTYDRVGNRQSRAVNNETEIYSYVPGTNRLQATSGQSTVNYDYDANGNTQTMGDKEFQYNHNNRMVKALSGGSVVGAYTYNGRGQRTIKQSAGKTTICHYDQEGRLIAETDEEGNVIREHFYLGSEPLGVFAKGTEQAGGETYLCQGTRSFGRVTAVVKLDVDARTIIIEEENGLVSQYEVPERYWREIQASGLRYIIARTSRRQPSSIRGMFILRGDQVSGTLRIIENGIYKRWRLTGERVAEGGGSADQFYYVHNDHLGTPKILTDDKGTVSWSADFKPFGNVALTNETTTNNLRFPGQYYDQETGLHYNYHRYYDPMVGRYLRADPSHSIGPEGAGVPYLFLYLINSPQELNHYNYVNSNPVIFNDPLGLQTGYKITGNIISEIGNILTNRTIGALKGAECASNYFRRSCAVPSKNDAWAECMTIFSSQGLAGGLYGSDDIISECAAECYRITHNKKYKELCSNDCKKCK
ncbi:RHS repeat-associated core domain-containing protein, partial [Thermodesulfobacteriota bacterium]